MHFRELCRTYLKVFKKPRQICNNVEGRRKKKQSQTIASYYYFECAFRQITIIEAHEFIDEVVSYHFKIR